MADRIGDWCQTFSGQQFWPMDPRPGEVSIVDIAHALSLLCRFGGHCRVFYSVAEHSVRVSWLVEAEARCQGAPDAYLPDVALAGLLHDASEAYLVDVPRPIKGHLVGYRDIEDRVQRAVCERFGVLENETRDEVISWADSVLLHTEARDLMGRPPNSWKHMVDPLAETIEPWSAERAEREFLARFAELAEGRRGA